MQRVLILGLAQWQAAAAQSVLEIGLSNDAAMAALQMPLSYNNVNVRGSWLHAEENSQRSNVFGVGFSVSGQSDIVQAHLGAKLLNIDASHVNAYGLALLGELDFNVGQNVWMGINVTYAPDIVFSGDFERYYEVSFSVAYQIIPQAQVFLGYQDAEAHHPGGSYRVYRGALAGFKFVFQ